MRKFTLIIYCFFSILIFSCKNKTIEIDYLDKKIPQKEKIKWLLTDENLDKFEIPQEGKTLIREIYKENKLKPFWSNDSSLTKKGLILLDDIKNPIRFGLAGSRINSMLLDSSHFLITEILLTNSLLTIHNDLKIGVLDSSRQALKPISYPENTAFFSKFQKTIQKTDSIHLEILKWGSLDTDYRKLALSLYHFAKKSNLKDVNFKVPSFKKDSVNSLNLAKKSLESKGLLRLKKLDSSTFYNALMKLQVQNGLKDDGVIGEFTADALNETNLQKCRRAALSLEKLRWRNLNQKKYILINIPEYKLRYYADDSLKNESRIVVGKYETKTPEFEASLRTIVVYPYWTVPYSITSKEILPDAKSNPNYFARNYMKIFKKEEEIDPLTVNWKGIKEKTFPFKAIQQPGIHNSLGIIKFEFYNKYGVYVHDTPSKSLFNRDIRSFSHGCIRCENPIELAKIILIKDNNRMIPDSLDSILSRKMNHPIHLKSRINIYIVYISVISKKKYEITFLRDIYKQEKKLINLIFS